MRVFESKRTRDSIAGALMLALGIYAAYQGASYNLGSLSRMGPGFFPATLGIALALVGFAIVATSRPDDPPAEHATAEPQWRGWLCILCGIVAFLAFGKHLGLVPASFAVVFVSAFADRRNTIKDALILALAMVAVCVVVFSWGLHLEMPLFSWH